MVVGGCAVGPAGAAGLRFSGGDVVGGRAWSGGLWDRGDVREDRDDRGRPGPGLRDSQTTPPSTVGESGRDVEKAVAQRLGLARGEDVRVAVQGQ